MLQEQDSTAVKQKNKVYTGKFDVIAMTVVKCGEQTLKLNVYVKTRLHFSNKKLIRR